MCILIFCTVRRDIVVNVQRFSCNALDNCQLLNTVNFLSSTQYKMYENPSSGGHAVPSGRTDSHFSKFYVLLTVNPRIIFCKQNQLVSQIFLICLLIFSTCFEQLCVHHHEKIPYLCDTWY